MNVLLGIVVVYNKHSKALLFLPNRISAKEEDGNAT